MVGIVKLIRVEAGPRGREEAYLALLQNLGVKPEECLNGIFRYSKDHVNLSFGYS